MINTEVINTTLADLRGPATIAFETRNTLYSELTTRNKVSSDGASYIERVHSGSVPARAVGLFSGDEALSMARTKVTKKLRWEPFRWAAAINIPRKDLVHTSTKTAVVKLTQHYVNSFVTAMGKDIETYLFTGAVSALAAISTAHLSGLHTLYGPFSSGRVLGVENGLLAHATKEAQSAGAATLAGLARNLGYFYYTQYDLITDWANHGYQKIRAFLHLLAHWSSSPNKGADICVMDPDTYMKLEMVKVNQIRIADVSKPNATTAVPEINEMGCRFRASYDIDRNNLTGNAANGMSSFLNLDHLEWVEQQKLEITDFDDRIPNQDVVTAKVSWQGQLLCDKPISQGVILGGN